MTVWDWKFRIFFQTEVKNEVKEWMTKLKYEEYKIYENIILHFIRLEFCSI